MRALWLPQVLRAAGLTVHEVSGWKTRGSDAWGPVRGITCHHTAGSRTSSIQGELNVLLNGSESAPPPIAQLLLARNGEWYVVASGTCFHNKVGWGGPNENYGNDALLGIEAQHSGGDEPWTQVQYDSYVRGVAALVDHNAPGWDVTVGRVAGHKEHQPGAKTDPTFSMPTFRTRVAAEIPKLREWDAMATEAQVKAACAAALREVLNDAQRLSPPVVAGRIHDEQGWAEMSDRAVLGRLFEGLLGLSAAFKAFVEYEQAEDSEDRTYDQAQAIAMTELKAALGRVEAALEPTAPGVLAGLPEGNTSTQNNQDD